MDISIIEELSKINSEEIRLLNLCKDSTIKEEVSLDGQIVKMNRFLRFLDVDVKKEKYAEIIYMIVGSSRHTIDDTTITLKQGEVLILNKNVHHKVVKLGNEDIATKILISEEYIDKCIFGDDFLIQFFLNTLFYNDYDLKFLRFEIQNIKTINNILENMLINMLLEEKISEETNILYLNLFFEHLKNEYNKLKFSKNAKDVRTVIFVMKFIEANLRDGELNEIADSLSISPYTLSKTVKKMTGYNFKELLQMKKLEIARSLLEDTDTPIVKIADIIGYENTSYFHKIFKKRFGVSPKQYRAK